MLPQGTSTFNAIIVIGKFDSFDENLENGRRRAATLARKIGPTVNAVIPVSAGVHRLVLRYRQVSAQYVDFIRFTRDTPDDLFSAMTDSHNGFVGLGDYPLSPERRIELVGETPWASFRAAALYARTHLDRSEAGFSTTWSNSRIQRVPAMIERTFVAQGPVLRCYRIIKEAESILEDGGYEYVEHCRKMDAATRAAGGRFLAILKRLAPAALPQDRDTVDELAAFVTRHAMQTCKSERVHLALRRVITEVRRIEEVARILE